MPVAWMWPRSSVQIQTSRQAGGMPSPPMRSISPFARTVRAVDPAVLEAAAAADAGQTGLGGVAAAKTGHQSSAGLPRS